MYPSSVEGGRRRGRRRGRAADDPRIQPGRTQTTARCGRLFAWRGLASSPAPRGAARPTGPWQTRLANRLWRRGSPAPIYRRGRFEVEARAVAATVKFESLKPVKAAQLIAQRVRDGVLSGELAIGDRLPSEKELIKQFGYSRAVVREGLRLLESEGLIYLQSGRNGGAVISSPKTQRLVDSANTILRLQKTTAADVHEAQRLIEPLVIQLAIDRATPDDLTAIRRTIELIEESPGDQALVLEQSNRFHTLLGEAAHNNVLAIFTTLMRVVVIEMAYSGDAAEALVIARIHRRILDAIEARDVKAATRRALRHLDATECVMNERHPTTTPSSSGAEPTNVVPIAKGRAARRPAARGRSTER
ncbi:MAG: FadR/GntR family transcriptional regulator [Alphaproteobacteria bacterium]